MTDFHAGEKHFFVYILCVASETMIDTMMCHNPMEKKRQEHIKELIMTEKAYIEDMRLVHEVYLLLFFLSRFYFSNLFHFLPFFNLLNLYNQDYYTACGSLFLSTYKDFFYQFRILCLLKRDLFSYQRNKHILHMCVYCAF